MKFYDWKMDAIRGGHGYHVDVGAFSTPITGGGTGATGIDQDQPEAIISVPDGTVIMPIRVSVVCQTPLIASDSDESEILVAADVAAAAAGATGISGATAETAVNMHTGSSNTSACSCYSASKANWTNPTLGMELGHAVKVGDVQGTAATALWGDLSLLYEPQSPPILTGPCALYVYWGGTVATSGFAQIEWIELSDA
jgi:hypothetical protein